MQAIQNRYPAADHSGLLRHIVHAAVYHVVVLLCARLPCSFCCAILQKFFMVKQLPDFSDGRIIKTTESRCHKFPIRLYYNAWQQVRFLITHHHHKALLVYGFLIRYRPRSFLPLNLIAFLVQKQVFTIWQLREKAIELDKFLWINNFQLLQNNCSDYFVHILIHKVHRFLI